MDENKKIEECDIEKVSGGSLENSGLGFRVFNSHTGETFGLCKDYGDAVNLAKRHNVSALGTWGNYYENKIREREDETGKNLTKIKGFE